MLKVSFQNSAGELDSRIVVCGNEVFAAIEEMIGEVDQFYHNDKIVIIDLDEVSE